MNRDYQLSLSLRKLAYKIETQLKELSNLHRRGINVLNRLQPLIVDINVFRSLLLEINEGNRFINRSRIISYQNLIEEFENLFISVHPQQETEFPEELLEVDILPPKLPPTFEEENYNEGENMNVNVDINNEDEGENEQERYIARSLRVNKVVDNMRIIMREMSKFLGNMNDNFINQIRQTRKVYNNNIDMVGVTQFIQRMRQFFNSDQIYRLYDIQPARNSRNYTRMLSLLFQVYATQTLFWNYEINNVGIMSEIILKLLYILMIIPLNVNQYPALVLEMEYTSLTQELMKKRKWFLHVQSIGYLLYSLVKYMNNQYIIYEKEQESDPIAILTNIRRIRRVKLYPIQYNNEELHIGLTRPFMDTAILGRMVPTYLEMRAVPYQLLKQLGDTLQEQINVINMIITNELERLRDNEHQVGFFPFYHTTECNLLRYQLAKSEKDYIEHKSVFNENCLIYAMKLSNLFTENEIYEMSLVCYGRIFSLTKFYEITEHFDFKIELMKYYEQRYKKYIFGTSTRRTLKLVLIYGHILLDEQTEISRVQLGVATRNPHRYIKSSQLMKILVKKKLLRPVKCAM